MVSQNVDCNLTDDLDKRPIAKLVQEASRYESSIFFEYKDKRVNAKSIMGMMTFLGIMSKAQSEHGQISVVVNGSDEEAALKSMVSFLCD